MIILVRFYFGSIIFT